MVSGLPAAFDNSPLKFEEFHDLIPQAIYVSATPADYELREAEGVVVNSTHSSSRTAGPGNRSP